MGDRLLCERTRAGRAGRDLTAPGRHPADIVRALHAIEITDVVVDEERQSRGGGAWAG